MIITGCCCKYTLIKGSSSCQSACGFLQPQTHLPACWLLPRADGVLQRVNRNNGSEGPLPRRRIPEDDLLHRPKRLKASGDHPEQNSRATAPNRSSSPTHFLHKSQHRCRSSAQQEQASVASVALLQADLVAPGARDHFKTLLEQYPSSD